MNLSEPSPKSTRWFIYPGLIDNRFIGHEVMKAFRKLADSMDELSNQLCRASGLTKEQVFSKSRKKEIILTRHVFYFLARRHLKLSYGVIGRYNDMNVDHSTIIHSEEAIQRRIDGKDVDLATLVGKLAYDVANLKKIPPLPPPSLPRRSRQIHSQ